MPVHRKPAAKLKRPAAQRGDVPEAAPEAAPEAPPKAEKVKKKSKKKPTTAILSALDPSTSSWQKRPLNKGNLLDSSFFAREMGTTNRAWAKALASMLPGLASVPGGFRVRVNMFSDCAGMASEVSALQILFEEVNKAYNVDIAANLVGACEQNQDAQHFLEKNFSPKIISADITERKVCGNLQQAYDHNLKTQEQTELGPIDVHVMGFPCTPWSQRGSGRGFEDPNSKPFFIGMSTVKVLKPKVFVWECVEGVALRSTSDGNVSDLEMLQQHLSEQLSKDYTLLILRNLSPTKQGFPMTRPRRAQLRSLWLLFVA
jgi:C-5 cytosine-specific DNA methylase